MKCANPLCRNELHYLRGGSLRLLELEGSPESRLQGDGGGFPVCRCTAHYFWLCQECSRSLKLRRWTQDGLVLEARVGHGNAPPPISIVHPEPAVDAEFALYERRTVLKAAGPRRPPLDASRSGS
jgi:hypothetical protein